MNINVVFDKLFDYYQINSLVELAHKLGVSQPALSQWKTRNAMSAVKKRCRELGIYNEIFGDLNSNINNFENSTIGRAFDLSSNSNSQDSFYNSNITPTCEKILKMNQTIVSSFINVYEKLEKKGDLKKLYTILGEIEFE